MKTTWTVVQLHTCHFVVLIMKIILLNQKFSHEVMLVALLQYINKRSKKLKSQKDL